MLNCVQILKHLASSKSCESFYSPEEMLEFRNQSKGRAYARKRKVYDSAKRAKKYQELKSKREQKNLNAETMVQTQNSNRKLEARMINDKTE